MSRINASRLLLECYKNQGVKDTAKNTNEYKGDTMSHKEHNVLGDYCWTCQIKTEPALPGWPKSSRDDGPKNFQVMPSEVIWADGLPDTQRHCSEHLNSNCPIPTHDEAYMYVTKSEKVNVEDQYEPAEL